MARGSNDTVIALGRLQLVTNTVIVVLVNWGGTTLVRALYPLRYTILSRSLSVVRKLHLIMSVYYSNILYTANIV